MKINKFVLGIALAASTLSLTSCLNGDNSQTYSNAYGYVGQDNTYNTFVNTSGGNSITWSGISSELTPGQCVRLSYTIDGSALSGYYNATEHAVLTKLVTYNLTQGTPISVNDSNFVTTAVVNASYYTDWYGDNWFLGIATKTYPGLGITPKFYYSPSIANNFDAATDSVIVDIRLSVTGTPSSRTTTETKASEFTVDLTPIRSLFSSFAGKAIPIYFRYYPTVSTKAVTTKTTLYIPSASSAS